MRIMVKTGDLASDYVSVGLSSQRFLGASPQSQFIALCRSIAIDLASAHWASVIAR